MQIYSITNQLYPKQNFRTSDKKQETIPEELIAKVSIKKSNISAATIITLTLVGGALTFSRGMQKNIRIYLNKFKNYLDEKRVRSTIKNSTKKTKMYENAIRSINSFINKSESINNITSLKDILFMKLMYKTKPTKNIHDSISKYFEKISRNTVIESYEKTAKDFNRMNKLFDELDEQILKNSPEEIIEIGDKKYTKRELVEEARSHREIAKMAIDVFLSKPVQQKRYEYIKDVTSSLYSSFWDASFKDFWSKNNKFKKREMWQTFIAAEQIRGNKTQLANWTSLVRDAITYTDNDRINNVYEYVKAIDNIMPTQDQEGIEIVQKLKCYAKNSDILKNNKDLFLKELQKLKEHKIIINSDDRMSKTIEDYKQTNVNLIHEQIINKDDGALQNMLSIYYKIAPLELEKFGALPALKRVVKSFDKSVNLESIELFDKVRDLRLGSAPTDILTVLFSFVTLSYGFGHAKDKDTRISVMLKSGIPIIGGIATMMYSAAKLVSGGKSIMLGLLSGIALNQLGIIADNIRKNHKTKDTENLTAV